MLVLLQRCLHLACVLPTAITNTAFKGSQLIVKLKCQSGHTNAWKSQPTCNRYSVGNLTSAAAVLFSANTYQRIASIFGIVNIQWLSKTSYYAIQKLYLTGIVNKNYIKMSKSILEEVKGKGPCYLSGDGRCDSPGRNTKYLTYSLTDKNTNKIVAFSLTQVSEAENSNRMAKMAIEKSLRLLKNKRIIPEQITTDRHIQVRKHLRDPEPGIIHHFDVWHFVKNIKRKLLAASKKSSCKIIEKWIKLIENHFWWACATCEGDPELLREK